MIDTPQIPTPLLDRVARVVVQLDPPVSVGHGPWGERRLVTIVGGHFDGPRMRGVVVPGGADWQVVHANGMISVTEQLIDSAVSEIERGQLDLLGTLPLLRAQANDRVRRTQEVLIAQALLERLIASMSNARFAAEHRLITLLDVARGRRLEEQGYLSAGALEGAVRVCRLSDQEPPTVQTRRQSRHRGYHHWSLHNLRQTRYTAPSRSESASMSARSPKRSR